MVILEAQGLRTFLLKSLWKRRIKPKQTKISPNKPKQQRQGQEQSGMKSHQRGKTKHKLLHHRFLLLPLLSSIFHNFTNSLRLSKKDAQKLIHCDSLESIAPFQCSSLAHTCWKSRRAAFPSTTPTGPHDLTCAVILGNMSGYLLVHVLCGRVKGYSSHSAVKNKKLWIQGTNHCRIL